MTEQDRNGGRPNVQLSQDSLNRPNERKRNKRVRLEGRLVGLPMSRTALPQLLWLTASMISG